MSPGNELPINQEEIFKYVARLIVGYPRSNTVFLKIDDEVEGRGLAKVDIENVKILQ